MVHRGVANLNRDENGIANKIADVARRLSGAGVRCVGNPIKSWEDRGRPGPRRPRHRDRSNGPARHGTVGDSQIAKFTQDGTIAQYGKANARQSGSDPKGN